MNERKRTIKRIDDLISGAGRKAFRSHGFVEASVVTKWRSIVGDMLAEHCLPLSMRFPRGKKRGATLSVQAEGAFALELQHLEPLIIERINVFFGYGAVEKLKIIHGPIPKSRLQKQKEDAPRKLSKSEENQIAALTTDIKDPKLRAAVASLGHNILTSKVKKPHESF